MDDRIAPMATIAIAALLVGAAVGAGAGGLIEPPAAPNDEWRLATHQPGEEADVGTFESAAAFEAYFDAAERGSGSDVTFQGQATRAVELSASGGSQRQMAAEPDGAAIATETAIDAAAEATAVDSGGTSGDDTERHSETNVQERALDEPDVLKTDGDSVYYAGHRFQRGTHETSVLNLSDPAEPEVAATIPASGDLLLVESSETLVVFDESRLWGYDVSDPSDPDQAWSEPIDADLQTARLYNGSLYLVLVDRPERNVGPCPLEPYGDESIPCTDVYRPDTTADADAVYTASRVDPTTGEVEDETSVVGSTRDSATYVSENAIYLTYTRSTSEYDLLTSFLTGPGSEYLDQDVVDRIEDLQSMNISRRAKSVELRVIVEEWLGTLDDPDRRDVEEDLQEGLRDYAEEHQRDLTTTGVVRVSIDGDMDVTASGEVPGYPLNQWSMDEHEGHLRIATTIPGTHGADSVNDVYVLDGDLDVTGSVEGLGETQRIYAVRFQGDEGYVVTFRRTDPFYTLDLSDPTNPEMEGELKIPGFSTYLHPLGDEGDLVLGVGEEDGRLKISTFDVSDRENPEELDVKIFEHEHFSAANENHNAFLHDERHGVFFLPAGEHSYVYSYEDGQLEEEAQVDVGGRGVRAMYVNDYLYVLGPEEIVVLNETTWEVETS